MGERLATGGVVGVPAQPDEAVRVVEVAELPDDVHADHLLGLDELAVEQLDQGVATPRMERVLAQVHDGAAAVEAGCRDHPGRLGAVP